MPTKWKLNKLASDLHKDIASHVTALRDLGPLVAETLTQTAQVIGIERSSLSKRLSGQEPTDWERIDLRLYGEAVSRSPGSAKVTVSRLSSLHEKAALAWAAQGPRKTKARSRGSAEGGGLCAECGAELTACPHCASKPSGDGDGQGGQPLANEQGSTSLPVPRREGDRQENKNRNQGPAREVTNLAADRSTKGNPEGALAALLGGRSVLTPQDSAAAVDDLHQQGHAGLAASFDIIYGRDEPAARVVAFAHDLLDLYDRPADATAALRAARDSLAADS